MLAEGYTIYNGSTKGVVPYLEDMGVQFHKYTNPADLLLKLANDPLLIKENLNFLDLSMSSAKNYAPLTESEKELMRDGGMMTNNFSVIGDTRNVNIFKQFWLLCKRTWLYTNRNPMSVQALIMIALFNSFILSSLYHGTGKDTLEFFPMTQDTFAHNKRVQQNWVGITYYFASDMFISMCMG